MWELLEQSSIGGFMVIPLNEENEERSVMWHWENGAWYFCPWDSVMMMSDDGF